MVLIKLRADSCYVPYYGLTLLKALPKSTQFYDLRYRCVQLQQSSQIPYVKQKKTYINTII